MSIGTTTATPSNGEALLTFEQQMIRDLIALEARRVEVQFQRAIADQSSAATEMAHSQDSSQRAARLTDFLTTALPILASLCGVNPKIEVGFFDPATRGIPGVAGIPTPAAAADESNGEESCAACEAEGIPTPAEGSANEVRSEEPRAAHG